MRGPSRRRWSAGSSSGSLRSRNRQCQENDLHITSRCSRVRSILASDVRAGRGGHGRESPTPMDGPYSSSTTGSSTSPRRRPGRRLPTPSCSTSGGTTRALADRVQGPEEPFELSAPQAPVPRPRQVFAIGMNYAAHAAEAGVEAPEFPRRSRSSRPASRGPTPRWRCPARLVDWEVELVAVIGWRPTRSRSARWSHVAGLTVGQDLSERIVQTHRLPRSSAWASRSRASARPARG